MFKKLLLMICFAGAMQGSLHAGHKHEDDTASISIQVTKDLPRRLLINGLSVGLMALSSVKDPKAYLGVVMVEWIGFLLWDGIIQKNKN